MSSEFLASGENVLDSNLGGAWDIINGYAGRKRDLGIARRFGGSSAAYSLRDIGAMNGRVVKARRDVGETSDPEEDFSANQVQSGALEDWVNGKLESTLPADVATAAAAYSLRKVKADYSGDAVRIRRTSDNIEVDVAFDSDDKVSASSAITNVAEQGGESGSTTATTLAGFLSEERTTFVTNPNFSAVSDVTVDSQTITNTTASVTFSGATGNGFIRDNSKPANIGAETGDTVSFDVTASGLNAQAGIRIRVVGANTDIISPAVNDIDNGTQNVSFTVGANSPAGYFAFTNLSTASSATITVSNLKVVGKSATVHTWYDQAGSNNAVQETAANQPKIAESGALLADGLKFNGNSDNFTITNGVSGRSIFAVTNQNIDTTTGGLTGYGQDGISSLLGTAGSDSYIFVSNNNSAFNSYAISIDGASSDSGQYASNGKTLSSAGGNLGTYGDIPSDTNSLLSIIYGSGDPANAWTRLGSGITGNIFMQGSMSEVILYTSDQSANRFKIESNINNYYGLYNDANEVTGAFTSSGAESFTANGTDGFTITNSSSTAFAGLELNQVLAAGEKIYISFNLSIDAGSNTSPNLNIRESSIIGGTASDEGFFEPTEGFNSTVFTSDSGGDARYISFGENDADPSTYSISDFKVSRIARNGFVETLYDQSGNGNDATQASAGNQPAIVQNGGLNSDGVRFDGVNDYMDFNTSLNAPLWSFIAHRATKNNSAVFGVTAIYDIWLGRRSTGTFLQVVTGVLSGGIYTDSTVLRTDKVDADGAEIFSNGTSLASGDNATSNLGDWGRLGGQGQLTSTKFLEGNIKEAVFYTTDKTSDRTEIETEINNHYNIF